MRLKCCNLFKYGVILTILILGLIAIGVTALIFEYAYKGKFQLEFKKVFLNRIENEYLGQVPGKTNTFTVSADVFQIYVCIDKNHIVFLV